MNRSRAVLAIPLACLWLFTTPLKAAEVEQQPVLVHLQAGLDVDREGHVSGVTFVDDKKVPDIVRRDAERIARTWRFQPPSSAGKPVSGRTYVTTLSGETFIAPALAGDIPPPRPLLADSGSQDNRKDSATWIAATRREWQPIGLVPKPGPVARSTGWISQAGSITGTRMWTGMAGGMPTRRTGRTLPHLQCAF